MADFRRRLPPQPWRPMCLGLLVSLDGACTRPLSLDFPAITESGQAFSWEGSLTLCGGFSWADSPSEAEKSRKCHLEGTVRPDGASGVHVLGKGSSPGPSSVQPVSTPQSPRSQPGRGHVLAARTAPSRRQDSKMALPPQPSHRNAARESPSPLLPPSELSLFSSRKGNGRKGL